MYNSYIDSRLELTGDSFTYIIHDILANSSRQIVYFDANGLHLLEPFGWASDLGMNYTPDGSRMVYRSRGFLTNAELISVKN